MTTMSMGSAGSPFQESEWDRRLDTMLADLETGRGGVNSAVVQQQQQQFSSYSYSSTQSSSQQFSSSSNNRQEERAVFSSQQQQQQHHSRGFNSKPVSFSLAKSASAVSLKDSAGGVLKDLEDGLVKSSHYIQESHAKYSGPDGQQEWHEVRRGEDPGHFDLERQVQHMIPLATTTSATTFGASPGPQVYSSSQLVQQQQHQQQYSSYANNSYGVEEEDRPGSRLKQNIDELDTLLYDLNNARNLSPERHNPDYTLSSDHNMPLDSEDYSETVGKEGHVKRTVHAFNEYSAQMSHADITRKPPSPSPRRKGPNSPPTNRRTQQTPRGPEVASPSYQPAVGPPGSGKPFTYAADSPDIVPQHQTPPPSSATAYYSKYSSVQQASSTTNSSRSGVQPAVPFPHQQARSPTPQSPPKRVEELMSEFREFESTHGGGGSPTPPMFSNVRPAVNNNSTLVVTELSDEEDHSPQQQLKPSAAASQRLRDDISPPRKAPAVTNKGPDVYYPPGADFGSTSPRTPTAVDGANLEARPGGGGAKAMKQSRGGRADRYGANDGADKQGAAVIPICLPLCCAAPCVIM